MKKNNNLIINETLSNIKVLLKKAKQNEIKCFLSNETDSLDVYLEIHAGAGGTESQDWAEMLRRMYMKWASNKSFKYQLISEHKGDEAGFKSSTIKNNRRICLRFFLKSESGIPQIGKNFSI